MKECKKKKFKMALESGLCQVVQGTFNQGNAMYRETAGIQCACMAIFGISYSFNLKGS